MPSQPSVRCDKTEKRRRRHAASRKGDSNEKYFVQSFPEKDNKRLTAVDCMCCGRADPSTLCPPALFASFANVHGNDRIIWKSRVLLSPLDADPHRGWRSRARLLQHCRRHRAGSSVGVVCARVHVTPCMIYSFLVCTFFATAGRCAAHAFVVKRFVSPQALFLETRHLCKCESLA